MHWSVKTNVHILLHSLTPQRIPIPYSEIVAEFGVTTVAIQGQIRKLSEQWEWELRW